MKRLLGVCVLAAGVWGCGSGGEPTGSTCVTQSLTYESFGRSFMERYCTRCHQAGNATEGVALDTREGVQRHQAAVDAVAAAGPAATNTGMPSDSPRPTPEERRQLGEWLACGAP